MFTNTGTPSNSIFSNCSALTDITLPSLENTGSYLFSKCSNLKNVTLPSVRFIRDYAFQNCNSLNKVILSNTSEVAALNILGNTTIRLATIYVPDELVDSYKSATNWSAYADRIKGLSELQ